MTWTMEAAPSALPRRLARFMLHNPAGLEGTSLRDDLAALYLLHPNMFGRVRDDASGRWGGHLEPCVEAAEIRTRLIVTITAGSALVRAARRGQRARLFP